MVTLFYIKENDGKTPPDWDNDLEKDRGQRKLETQHGINKYVIPVSIAVAMLAGGIIAPQLQGLDVPGLFAISVVAFVGLLAYLIYYLWVYYFSSKDD
jgi:hypothetical protein